MGGTMKRTLDEIIREPVFFERNRVYRVYRGGKLFHDLFGDEPRDGHYPEEWIASDVRALNERKKGDDLTPYGCAGLCLPHRSCDRHACLCSRRTDGIPWKRRFLLGNGYHIRDGYVDCLQDDSDHQRTAIGGGFGSGFRT